jgi:hypothetical protein
MGVLITERTLFKVGIFVFMVIVLMIAYMYQPETQLEGMDTEDDPPTTEQAYLANNLLAKIATDDPALSNAFGISIIRSLGITSPAFVSILDKDTTVKLKLKALAILCKSTRPALPNGFAYATLPDNLFANESKPITKKKKKK